MFRYHGPKSQTVFNFGERRCNHDTAKTVKTDNPIC